MLNIKILGTGCPNCQRLEKNVRKALATASLKAEVEKVEDIPKIMNYGVMNTPALVVNEKLVFSGRVASPDELGEMLVDLDNGSQSL